MKEFVFTERVYYSDTNYTGMASIGAYINWAEHGRTEALRSFFPLERYIDMYEKRKVLVAVKKISYYLFSPAFLDDTVTVKTVCRQMGAVSAIFEQEVKRGGEVLVRLTVTLCFVNPETGVPTRIPLDIRRAFENDDTRNTKTDIAGLS